MKYPVQVQFIFYNPSILQIMWTRF